MTFGALDQINHNLDEAIGSDSFESAYGKQATSFLAALPALYRLYRRVPFDFEFSVPHRHMAAAVAMYISETQDFLDDKSHRGLIDDVWIAFAALNHLVAAQGEESVSRHWRSEADFNVVVGLAENVDTLAEHVPSKVLEKMQAFLGQG
jgi:hypothetical protein